MMEALPLIDTFGRKHDYLRISLTEKCNLRCVYCMPEQGIELKPGSSYMQKDEVIAIASEFVKLGVRKIRLTGGEPLVRKDAGSIIRALTELDVEIGITTNAVLVDQYIDLFEECGIHSLNVSIDTFNPERMKTIVRRDYAERILSNIELLQQRNFKLKLNAVLVKGMNDDELISFIEYTKNRNVEFRFIEFMPFDGNRWDKSRCVGYDEILNAARNVYGVKVTRQLDGPNDTARHFRIDGYVGSFAVISSITNPFCDTCNRLRLTADGKMRNCLFSGAETDLLSAYRNGQPLEPLIRNSVEKKKAVRAGYEPTNEDAVIPADVNQRAMVAIGG
jgi:molybdenum cofactor biosynthesis protein A